MSNKPVEIDFTLDSRSVERSLQDVLDDVVKVNKAFEGTDDALKMLSRRQLGLSTDKALGELKQLDHKIRDLKPAEVNVKVKKDESAFASVGRGFDGLKGKALAVTAAVAGIAYGIKNLVGPAMRLERYQVSMKHWVGVNNPGMSNAQIDKTSADYTKYLRKNANVTPFETNEVMSAGTRALTIAGGDIGKSKEMLKMAEDMAALNPEKTLTDAMEALADGAMGEMERLKEFGFKAGADEYKAAGGDLTKIKSRVGNKTLGQMFAGGSEKLANTDEGRLSTITGTIQNIGTDLGTKLMKSMGSTVLKSLGGWLGKNEKNITKSLTGLVDGISKGLEPFKPIFKEIVDLVGPTLESAFKLAGSTFKWLGKVFQVVAPYISGAIEVMWAVAKPPLMALKWVIEKITEGLDYLSNYNFAKKYGELSSTADQYSQYADPSAVYSNASGKRYVPYDGYTTKLHQGERVLTASESRNLEKGSSGGVTINVNGMTVREEADINKIAEAFYQRYRKAAFNMA